MFKKRSAAILLYFFLLFYFHFYFLLDSFYCRNFTNCWYFNNLDIFLGVPCKESLWTRVLYSAFIYEREVLPKKSSHHLEWAMLLSVSILRSQIHTELAQFAWLVRITELIFSIICKTQKKKNKAGSEKTNQNAYVGVYLPHKYMWWSVSLESFVPQQSLECSCFVYQMLFLYAWVEQGNMQHKATNFPHLLSWQFIRSIWMIC